MLELVIWAASALGALAVATLAFRRLAVALAKRRLLAAEASLRPVALALLAGDTGTLRNLTARDATVLVGLVDRYRSRISGASADRITAFFEQRGVIDRELRALASRRAWRRATAAFTLGSMGALRAAPALIDALQDRNRNVRVAAARSLGNLAVVGAVEPLVLAFAHRSLPRLVAGQALLSIGAASLPALCRLASEPDPEARAFAIELIGLVGEAEHAGDVISHLRDGSAEVRAKAARALGRLGAEDAAAELAATLYDRIAFVRVVAARALGVVGDKRAVPALLDVARHDEFAAAQAAAWAAARLDPRAVARAAAQEGAGAHLVEAATLAAVRG